MKIRYIFTSAISVLILMLAAAPGFAEQTYKVRQGDNLSKIARSFKTTPETLKEINGLKNDMLRIGQILTVSIEPPAASVKPDETASIQASVETVANTDNPEQGQTRQAQQTQKETQTYKVRAGDTLYGIARLFNSSVSNLTASNNLKNSNIKVGQILVISGENKTAAETQAAKSAKAEPAPVKTQSAAAGSAAASAPRAANQTDLISASIVNAEELELTRRDRLVEAGFKMLGIRYRYGGTSEKTGLDCSALVKNLFSKFDLTLPRTSREQYKQGEKVAREDLQKGDLVFFSSSGKTPTHVGIYIGDNQFLHAARAAQKVVVSDLSKTWYNLRYLGARRIMELWWENTETPLSDDDAQQEGFTASTY